MPPETPNAATDSNSANAAHPRAPRQAFSFSVGEMLIGSTAAAAGMALAGFSGPIVFAVLSLGGLLILGLAVQYLSSRDPATRIAFSTAVGLMLLGAVALSVVSWLPLFGFVSAMVAIAVLGGVVPIVAMNEGPVRGICLGILAIVLIGGPYGAGYFYGVVEAEVQCGAGSRSIYYPGKFVNGVLSSDAPERDFESGLPILQMPAEPRPTANARISGHNWRIRASLQGSPVVGRMPWTGLVMGSLLGVAFFGLVRWSQREPAAIESPATQPDPDLLNAARS